MGTISRGDAGLLRAGSTRGQRRADWAVLAPGFVTFAVMLTGITGASFWTDEAATVSAIRRSLPQLLALLRNVDAVHGLYYLLLWPVAHVFGTSEITLRLPSAVITALAACGVAAIGKRLRSPLTGLLAGLVFAGLPVVSLWGQNARPYAMTIAVATLASYLLIVIIDRPGSRRALCGYAASIALLGYLNLFGLLILPAHAITLMHARTQPDRATPEGVRQASRGWLIAAAAGCAATVPVALAGWRQKAQIGWLPMPRFTELLTNTFGVVTIWSAILLAALTALGSAHEPASAHERPDDQPPRSALIWLSLPWLLLPPVSLFAVSYIKHAYYPSYIAFCLPGAALLAGAGLAALRPRWRAAAVAAVIALVWPGQVAARAPGGHNEDIRDVAQYVRAHAQPGDAVIYWRGFWPDTVPDWASVYPYGLTEVDDIGLAKPAVALDSLYGAEVPLPVLEHRLAKAHRLWVVELGRDVGTPRILPAGQFRLVTKVILWQMYLRLYTRT